jgi:hypothetical protein
MTAVGAIPAAAATRTSLATVERRDLVEREDVSGTLGYSDADEHLSPRAGTITRLPKPGTVIERGQVVFDVDAQGIPLLYGEIPIYRDLRAGVSDGADVRQLEDNLAALGFGDGLTVDDHFDAATTRALRAWQESLGMARNGVLTASDAVVAAGPVRVASLVAKKGARVGSGTPVLSTTGTSRTVKVRLETSRQSLATVGGAAQIVLPDGSVADGTVVDVGTVATKDSEQSSPKIDVTVALDDGSRAGALTEAPVTVRLTKATAEDVLTVPVRALLALSEGGYAVEVKRNGTRSLVGVDLGAFADGSVEVAGDLRAGDRVVMPS